MTNIRRAVASRWMANRVCRGCGERFDGNFTICRPCRLIPRTQRPLYLAKHRPPGPVCDCGRDFLHLTVEEMSKPCPFPKR